MTKLIAILGILVVTNSASGGILSNVLDHNYKKITNLQKNIPKISNNKDITITQQDTIYIDKDGKQQTTSAKYLSNLDITEIIQIGFYENSMKQIQVVRMPKTIEKVPNQLPHEITNISDMFDGASLFNQDISQWNVSNVTDMAGMFYGASLFNKDLSKWNVSNVTDMETMFWDATSFNQDISKWDTSKVTNMLEMFHGVLAFNQDISKWDTSKVTNMSGMFSYASSFNQDLSKWNVSNVSDMSFMFSNAVQFNQDISKWNVSKVDSWNNFATNSGITDPNKLPKFKNITITQQDTIYIDKDGKQQTTSQTNLSDLDTTEIIQIGFYQNVDEQICAVRMPRTIKKVPNQLPHEITNISDMFYGASSFNQNISTWNISNVSDMTRMFDGASSFNQDLSKWNVSNVTNISDMFCGASSFNQNISIWNVSSVKNMSNMFCGATLFNQDISQWNVSDVSDMTRMFADAKWFNQDISQWNVSNVTNMSNMFCGASLFNQDISKWNVSNVDSWDDFARGSGITVPNKLPKFKKLNNNTLFEKDYRFLAHDWLKISISYNTFLEMRVIYNNEKPTEIIKKFYIIINKFHQLDNTGWFGSITKEDIYTVAVVIMKNFKDINNVFKTLKKEQGLVVTTNTIGSWDKEDNMGAFTQ